MSSGKSIILMLDIGSTIEEINDQTAKYFIDIINYLINYYESDNAIIFISTHDSASNRIKHYLDILNKHITPNIKIGINFYLDGTYDYNNNHTHFIEPNYNYNKTDIFEKNYLYNQEYNITWFGIIDDHIEYDYIRKFKDTTPMTIFRPSQRSPLNLEEDNIMCYSTYTRNFNGVIELLERKLEDTKSKNCHKLFEEQQNTLLKLNNITILEIIKNKQYNLLLRYIKETNIDPKHLSLIISILSQLQENISQTKEIINYIESNNNIPKPLTKKLLI